MQANLGAAGARTAYVGGDDLVSRSPERESRGIRRARASVASAPSGGRRKASAGAAADAAHGAAAARGRCGRADEHAANLCVCPGPRARPTDSACARALSSRPRPPAAPPSRVQVFADPYKATVTKENGSEVEEDIYEAYNLSLVSRRRRGERGAAAQLADGQ
jgi:hypothetical protein